MMPEWVNRPIRDKADMDEFIENFIRETDRRTDELLLGFSPYRDEHIPDDSARHRV